MSKGAKILLAILATPTIAMLAWLYIANPGGLGDDPATDPSPSDASRPDPEMAARMACVDALRNSAKFPSSFDYSPFSDPPQAMRLSGGGYLIRVDFTAKNGFGSVIPLAGHCMVKNGAVVNIESDPR